MRSWSRHIKTFQVKSLIFSASHIFVAFFQVLLQPTEIAFTSKASRKNGTQAETRLARGLKQSRWWWRWVSQPLRDFIEITSIGTQQGDGWYWISRYHQYQISIPWILLYQYSKSIININIQNIQMIDAVHTAFNWFAESGQFLLFLKCPSLVAGWLWWAALCVLGAQYC
jgi:hypothetical protein